VAFIAHLFKVFLEKIGKASGKSDFCRSLFFSAKLIDKISIHKFTKQHYKEGFNPRFSPVTPFIFLFKREKLCSAAQKK
jgi:hypothetical protein